MDNKNEKLQESQMKLQFLHQQIKETEKQSQLMNNQMMELTLSNQYLDDFEKLKPGTEILVPINQGMYAKAELKETKKLTVNIGANVSVQKNISDTKKLLENQIVEIKNIQNNLVENLQKLASQAASVEKEIKDFSKK